MLSLRHRNVAPQSGGGSRQDTIRTEIAAQTQIRSPVPNHAYAGGFGYIDDGAEVWATAFRYRPLRAKMKRVFGMGHDDTQIEYRNIRVTRRDGRPTGNDPLIVVEIQIENLSDAEISLSHFEYWDINIHQLQLEWLRTGAFGAASDDERRNLNKKFTQLMTYEPNKKILVLQQIPPQNVPSLDTPSTIDWHPATVFLSLILPVSLRLCLFILRPLSLGRGTRSNLKR